MMQAGGRRPGPRQVQVGAESALGGRLGTAVASAHSAVSTPPRQSQRPRHPSRQYPVAPESVSAPLASSVPHCASVSGRTVRVVSTQSVGAPSESVPLPHRRRLRRGVLRLRARLAPQLETTACRVSDGTNERTERLGQAVIDKPRDRALCPHPGASLGPLGRLPRRLRLGRTTSTTPPAGRTVPDPGPCLRHWGCETGQ